MTTTTVSTGIITTSTIDSTTTYTSTAPAVTQTSTNFVVQSNHANEYGVYQGPLPSTDDGKYISFSGAESDALSLTLAYNEFGNCVLTANPDDRIGWVYNADGLWPIYFNTADEINSANDFAPKGAVSCQIDPVTNIIGCTSVVGSTEFECDEDCASPAIWFIGQPGASANSGIDPIVVSAFPTL